MLSFLDTTMSKLELGPEGVGLDDGYVVERDFGEKGTKKKRKRSKSDAGESEEEEDAVIEAPQALDGDVSSDDEGDADAAAAKAKEAEDARREAKRLKKKAKLAEVKARAKEKRRAEREAAADDAQPSSGARSRGIAHKPGDEQAAWLTAKFAASKFASSMSAVERIVVDASWMKTVPPSAAEPETLPDYLRAIFADSWKRRLTRAPKSSRDGKYSPALVIVCSGAIRCLDVIKQLGEFRGEAGKAIRIAKLFARHMKVDQQAEMLKAPTAICVGTPNRILKLVQIGALNVSRTDALMLDMHVNDKGVNVMTMPDTAEDVLKLLHHVAAQAYCPEPLQIAMW